MVVKHSSEPMPLAEIEALYPNHWILIDKPVIDDQKRLIGGTVVFVGAEKKELYRRLADLVTVGFAIRCTKKDPPDRKYI